MGLKIESKQSKNKLISRPQMIHKPLDILELIVFETRDHVPSDIDRMKQ